MRIYPLSQLCCLLLCLSLPKNTLLAYNVGLAWDPSPDAAIPGKLSGYNLYFSTNLFNSISTNSNLASIPCGLNTNIVVTNLTGGITYYFAVTSVDADGLESDPSNIASHTFPPDPPPVEGESGTDGGTIGNTSGSIAGETGGTTTEPKVSSPPPPGPTEAYLYGQLPRLILYGSNGIPSLQIAGTLGATLAIQSSSSVADPNGWLTLTNLKLSTTAPEANPAPVNSLEKAFIPALETWQDLSTSEGSLRFYRIYMPFGYSIIADQVLTEHGYNTRLVAVRLPGIDAYIVCYVTEESVYIDYDDQSYVAMLEQSGPTIREIATTVAATLSQNWTSASEFTVTDGTKQLVATVVQTDPPELDPPIGEVQSSSIVLDF